MPQCLSCLRWFSDDPEDPYYHPVYYATRCRPCVITADVRQGLGNLLPRSRLFSHLLVWLEELASFLLLLLPTYYGDLEDERSERRGQRRPREPDSDC